MSKASGLILSPLGTPKLVWPSSSTVAQEEIPSTPPLLSLLEGVVKETISNPLFLWQV